MNWVWGKIGVNRVGPRNLHWAMFTDGVVVLQLPDPLRDLPRILCWVSARIDPNGRAETPDTTHEGVAFTSCPKPLVAHAVKAVRGHRFQTSTTGIVSVLPVLLGDPKVNMTPRLNAQLFPPDTPEGVVKRVTAQGGPSSGCTVAVRVHPDRVPQVLGATHCTEASARATEATARNWRWRKTATSREGIIRVLFSATP